MKAQDRVHVIDRLVHVNESSHGSFGNIFLDVNDRLVLVKGSMVVPVLKKTILRTFWALKYVVKHGFFFILIRPEIVS